MVNMVMHNKKLCLIDPDESDIIPIIADYTNNL